ncbi:NAD(P)/FAD-dependent oxidoreductase [Metamycoplasma hominis]|uniref:NAD(P)/FAD-dependent oxidoreductase n=1 Tax=Metamycoplasma hominis TaxID=2098 RepID=UPI001E331373|nr:FAD-dependent oxidoreductase [Metamycoplasma hominis]
MENNNLYDVLIIGAGPAGLTAAIYLARNDINVAFIEGGVPGGKVSAQSKIENYPGFSFISGFELSKAMLKQARDNGSKFIYGNVKEINSISDIEKEVILENGMLIKSKAIIIATGMKEIVPLDVKGIEEYRGKGVSYCVICDGPLYKNKPCAIIGGGNSAFEESSYLASIASEVHIFVRDGIIAEKKLVNEAMSKSNIYIHENSTIKEILGNEKVEEIIANVNGKETKMNISCIFPYVGFKPNTAFIKGKYDEILNSRGFIEVNENMETKIPNIFAIGDVIVKDVRQITTATADGTIAARAISNKIDKLYK